MPDRMPEWIAWKNAKKDARMGAGIRCQNRCQKECQNIYQKISQIECQNICIYIYATFTSRWYAINYVRILCPGGDQSKKEISVCRLSKFWNRQESNIAGMNMKKWSNRMLWLWKRSMWFQGHPSSHLYIPICFNSKHGQKPWWFFAEWMSNARK